MIVQLPSDPPLKASTDPASVELRLESYKRRYDSIATHST